MINKSAPSTSLGRLKNMSASKISSGKMMNVKYIPVLPFLFNKLMPQDKKHQIKQNKRQSSKKSTICKRAQNE